MDFKKKLKQIIAMPEIVEVKTHNAWKVLTDFTRKRKPVDTITKGKPQRIDCKAIARDWK